MTLDQFSFQGKRALVRVDFNVALDKQGNVTDNTRIKGALPTIHKILKDGGSVVLLSHLGRPKGGVEAKYSLHQIVSEVSILLGREVLFVEDCISEKSFEITKSIQPGTVVLLENLRFYPEEEKGDLAFAEKLSKHGDIYVNDAFGTAHRAHASTTIVAKFFPKAKCFGYLMAKEVESLEKVLNHSEKPVLAVVGGAKVSSKLEIVSQLLNKVNHIIIGGGMAFTFIRAKGGATGGSLIEADMIDMAKQILETAQQKNVQIHLPVDAIVADKFDNQANKKTQNIMSIEAGWMGLDIGPASETQFDVVIQAAKTILWNGPMGVFEMPSFAHGTIAVAKSIANATKNGSFSLVGGGDSVAAVNQFGLADQVSYVSTGGGAMLEYLEGKVLPGVAAILAAD
jgi:phosphoglycerate kinase